MPSLHDYQILFFMSHRKEPMKSFFLSSAFVLVCALSMSAESNPAADLIIRNARVWTVDASHAEAEAVAVLGHRIVAVGSNQDVDAWRGPNTRTVDAEGKRLLPGFNDAHVHFVDGGSALDYVQLNDATSAREFARRIGERAAKMNKGEWLQGGDWDETKWTPAELPTKEMIDPLTADIPVAVNRYDGHMVAGELAGAEVGGNHRANPGPSGWSHCS